jgi:hypothetical protein
MCRPGRGLIFYVYALSHPSGVGYDLPSLRDFWENRIDRSLISAQR